MTKADFIQHVILMQYARGLALEDAVAKGREDGEDLWIRTLLATPGSSQAEDDKLDDEAVWTAVRTNPRGGARGLEDRLTCKQSNGAPGISRLRVRRALQRLMNDGRVLHDGFIGRAPRFRAVAPGE